MILSFKKLCRITPILVLMLPACKKDKPNIEVSFCNGGMVPDTVIFTETNIDGADYIWQLFAANGTALSDPTPTAAVNSIYSRFDSAGSYKVRVDVDNKSSAEIDFTLRDFVTEGTEVGVSFYDSDLTVWTIFPESDCNSAIQVQRTNGIGGIDYLASNNRIYYVPNDLISCFPNGEDLETISADRFSLRDIVIDQSNEHVLLAAFDQDLASDVIVQTTVDKLVSLPNDVFDEIYLIGDFIEQLTYDPMELKAFYTIGNEFISSIELTAQADTTSRSYGSDLEKTALVFDISHRRLYFAEGNGPCMIVAVNPDQPGQRLFARTVPCDGSIRGMDIDEVELDIVYTDSENIWLINVDNQNQPRALITDVNRVIERDELDPRPIDPPISDVVIARYRN